MSGQDIRTHHQRASGQHIHPDTPSEAIRTTYPDRICCCPGVIIVSAAWAVAGCLFHSNNLSGQGSASTSPECLTSGNLLPRHSTQMYHIWNSAPPTFHPNVSHLEFCSAAIPPGCLTSGTFHSNILHPAPDAGWERRRFNFLGKTYPDPLIEFTRRVSQQFCAVSRCSLEASRYVRPTFLDIFLHSAAVFS